MARTVTLTQLQTDCRLYADQRPGGADAFVNDTELTRLINTTITELYDLLVAARGHEYYIDEDAISVVSDTSRYNLPSDFYQLFSITLEWSSDDHEALSAFDSIGERADLNNLTDWGQWNPKAYRLRGSQVEFLPMPSSAVTARLQYVPTFTDLSGGGDTFDGVNGWEKLVTLKVAMEMRTIEGLPYSDLERLYEWQLERIQGLAADRAAEAPKVVGQVYPEGSNGWPRGFRVVTP